MRMDVIIAGGSHIGMSLGVALKMAVPQLDVMVVEAAPQGAWRKDPRAFAIAAATVRMLRVLEIWEAIEAEAQPIHDMIITDSRLGDPVRPTFLTFAGDVLPGEAFAYMVENKHVNAALHQRAEEVGLVVRQATKLDSFDIDGARAAVRLDDGSQFVAPLIIGADGVRSKMREMAGIQSLHWPYGQMGLVCTVAHERDHHGRAIEHFLPAGPFAILPLRGNRCSLVWNESEAQARRLMQCDDLLFEMEVEQRFGHHLGALEVEGERRAFPFGLTLARDFVRPRFALIGDAAHAIHPISGQGLNLGFRDVAALAEIIVETYRLGLDIGSLVALERYQGWRRFETVRMGITTDLLNRLFSNDNALLRGLRDFGLGLVDRLDPIKNYFIKEASGLTKDAPKLLLGQPL